MAHGQRVVGEATVVSRPYLDMKGSKPSYVVVIFDRIAGVSEHARFRTQDEALDFYLQVLEHGRRPEGG